VISYTYDAVGNRKTKTENGSTTTYVYDDNNRLIQEDDIIYSYDDNGNLKEKNSAEENIKYFYDAENHLTRVETTRFGTTIVIEYEYDAEGNRVRKVLDGTVVTNYLVDANRDYAQVLEERDGSGNLLVRYVYGHDLISQTRGGATTYYHYDGLGSTRALTASSEAVTDTYTYDAFGLLLEQTGTTENNYLYRGEQFDPELGFYYLRARYMDPNVGRFVTMDEFSGLSQDPFSLHKYLYANANPITYNDPSGYSNITEINMGTVIRGVLSRIGSFGYTAARNTLYGGLFGAITSGIDAWLGGENVVEAMLNGAKGGATVGFLATIPYVRPIITVLGLKSSLEGIYDSLRQGKSAQAAFRAFVLYWQIKRLTSRTWDSEACFTEETLIYTKKGHKPIKDTVVGDEVYAKDIETGEKDLKRVKQVFTREVKILIYLAVDGVEIKTTVDHPFWVTEKGWVPAEKLHIGDHVELSSGKHENITSIKRKILTQPITVYNLEVEDCHTYFVSEKNILVHNADYDLSESRTQISETGLKVTVDDDGIPMKWEYTVGEGGERGTGYFDVDVGQGMHRGHVKSVMEGAGVNSIDDGFLNIIEQSPTVNLSNVKRFENWRVRNAQGAQVTVERLPNGYIRTQIPSRNIDVTYNPYSNNRFPNDWFQQGGTYD
jgi:RHS repeat-associated protein